MAVDRVRFSGAPFRLGAEIRGCEPEIMKVLGWPWPWPFEVRVKRQVIAVCLDHNAALGAVIDWNRNTQGVE